VIFFCDKVTVLERFFLKVILWCTALESLPNLSEDVRTQTFFDIFDPPFLFLNSCSRFKILLIYCFSILLSNC
jgi:hypothetical protein